jgi:hypothetical protein
MKVPRELAAGSLVRGEDFNALLSFVKRNLVAGVGPGMGFKNSGAGRFVSLTHSPLDRVRSATTGGTDPGTGGASIGFFAEITAATSAGSGTNQWVYTAQKVSCHPALGAYAPGQWIKDGADITCYNSREVINSAFGVQGNGVDVDGADFPAGFEIQPCPVGNIVWLHRVGGDDTYLLSFEYENGIDGTCAAP